MFVRKANVAAWFSAAALCENGLIVEQHIRTCGANHERCAPSRTAHHRRHLHDIPRQSSYGSPIHQNASVRAQHTEPRMYIHVSRFFFTHHRHRFDRQNPHFLDARIPSFRAQRYPTHATFPQYALSSATVACTRRSHPCAASRPSAFSRGTPRLPRAIPSSVCHQSRCRYSSTKNWSAIAHR